MTVQVIHADCRVAIPELIAQGIQVDAVVTDAPYGLEFMGKDWDAPWQVSSKSAFFGKRDRATPGWGVTRNANCRACGGRLRGARKCSCEAPDWDEAPNETALRQMMLYAEWCADWAAEAFEILRPGGFLVTFGGTRTVNWLACGIEIAGFTKQDELLWLFGEGWPKHRSQLKPAYEPLVVAYKPPGNARTLQVDECRIPTTDELNVGSGATNFAAKPGRRIGSPLWGGPMKRLSGAPGQEGRLVPRQPPADGGRWPANICHDGSDEVLAVFPFSAGQQGDIRGTEPSEPLGGEIYGQGLKRQPFKRRRVTDADEDRSDSPQYRMKPTAGTIRDHGDVGSAARFFYSSKAGPEDRWGSRHPTVKPVELMKWLVPLFTPPGGLFLDCFAGSGTAGVAALATGRHAILIEQSAEYIADIRERMAFYEGVGRHSLVSKNRNRREATGTLL